MLVLESKYNQWSGCMLVFLCLGQHIAADKLMRSDPGTKIEPGDFELTAPLSGRLTGTAVVELPQSYVTALDEQSQTDLSQEALAGDVAFSSRMLLPDGQKVIYDFTQSERNLCTPSKSGQQESLYTLWKTDHDEGCGYDSGRMHMLSNARLGFSDSSGGVRLQLQCQFEDNDISDYSNLAKPETQGAGFEIVSQLFGKHQPGDWKKNSSTCQEVKEDTILVMKPRGEDFVNVFHNMEAVFGLLQTADVLQRPLSDFRIVVVYGNMSSSDPAGFFDLVQLDGQLERTSTAGTSTRLVPTLLAPMLELWSALVHKENAMMPVLPSSIPTAAGLCFTGRVVLPMHACSGEIFTRTWSDERRVHRRSPLTMRYTQQILQAIHLDNLPSKIEPTSRRSVLLVVRGSPERGRQIRIGDMEDLKDKIHSEFPVNTKTLDFATLSYAQQIRNVRNSSIMVGVHGAGLTHLMFLPENGGVVEITEHPPPYGGFSVANIYYNLAAWTKKIYYPVKAVDSNPYMNFKLEAVTEALKYIILHQDMEALEAGEAES